MELRLEEIIEAHEVSLMGHVTLGTSLIAVRVGSIWRSGISWWVNGYAYFSTVAQVPVRVSFDRQCLRPGILFLAGIEPIPST